MTIAIDIYKNASALFARLPRPTVSARTMQSYLKATNRMLAEAEVDPLRSGDARDSYNFRRAALHAGIWYLLDQYLRALNRAAEENDLTQSNLTVEKLKCIVTRCGPAIERDPPMDRKSSTFGCAPSRWAKADVPHPSRGKGSKKHVLPHLPDDWTDQVWRSAADANWKYLDALAIFMLTPARPVEFVPGIRDGKQVAGIKVCLTDGTLVIEVVPAKSHHGKYGTERSEITIDAKSAFAPIHHLVRLCGMGGGTVIVSLGNTNAMRKALQKLGQKAFSGSKITITPYLFRHQNLADLKATVGAGGEVAAAAGHCTDRTQSHYGRVQQGRKRSEFISAVAQRTPRCGNIKRARELARKRLNGHALKVELAGDGLEDVVDDGGVGHHRNDGKLGPSPHNNDTVWVDPERSITATILDRVELPFDIEDDANFGWAFGARSP